MKYLYLSLWLIFCITKSAGQAIQPILDSLQTELSKSQADSNRVNILNELAFYSHFSQPEQGIEMGQQALALATELKWSQGKAQAMAMVGINYEAIGKAELALEFESQSLELHRKLGNRKAEASMLSNISLIYLHQSDYSQALKYALKAKALHEKLGQRKNLAIVYENIGVIFFRLQKYEKTREYYQWAYKIYEELEDEAAIARNQANQGLLYYDLGDYEQAEEYYLKSLATNKKLGLKQSQLINYGNLGNVESKRGDHNKAEQYYQKALALAQELNNQRIYATTLGNTGDLYLKMAQQMPAGSAARQSSTEKAIKQLEEAVRLCRELNFLDPTIEFYYSLSDAYALKKDYATALSYHQLYAQVKDSIRSKEKGQELSQMESRHELEIRDKDIRLKDNQIKLQKMALAQQRSQVALYIAGLMVLILLLVLVLRKWLNSSQSNRELSETNKAQLALIESQLDDIKKRSTILNEIAYMQAHDVRGPLSTILGLIKLFNHEDPADPFNKYILDNLEKVTKEMDQAVREVIQKKDEFPS